MGGVIEAIETGYFQNEIAKSSEIFQREIDAKERIVVGVNKYQKDNEEIEIPILEIGKETERIQIKRLKKLKVNRDNDIVKANLNTLRSICRKNDNVLPAIIECVKAYCTLGEIVDSMKDVFGDWQESAII